MSTFVKIFLATCFVAITACVFLTVGCTPYDVVSEVPTVPTSFWSP